MSGKSSKYENQTLPNGIKNKKYIDLLDEDHPIAGQKFACISFVSPENILKLKNTFLFESFLKQWDISKSLEKFTQFINFLSYKYNFNFENAMKDLEEFNKDEKDKLFSTTLEDEYKSYLDRNDDKLEKDFNMQYEFQTSTRGIKVRGVFPSQEEAELRCKMLRELDPNHDVYVGPVGMWMPWEPDAYKTGRVEYLEDELNQLMHEKKNNDEKTKSHFDQRVKDAKTKAIEDNIQKAKESGNPLTQTLNNDGDLVSVASSSNNAFNNEEMTSADIRKELFEGENIVVGKTDHGLSGVQGLTFNLDEDKANEVDNETNDTDTVDANADDSSDENSV